MAMSNPLQAVRAVLDEVLGPNDARKQESTSTLRRATIALLNMENVQDELPRDLGRKFASLLSHLRENAWLQHPELGIAEIKRFRVAVLKAIQSPDVTTVH